MKNIDLDNHHDFHAVEPVASSTEIDYYDLATLVNFRPAVGV